MIAGRIRGLLVCRQARSKHTPVASVCQSPFLRRLVFLIPPSGRYTRDVPHPFLAKQSHKCTWFAETRDIGSPYNPHCTRGSSTVCPGYKCVRVEGLSLKLKIKTESIPFFNPALPRICSPSTPDTRCMDNTYTVVIFIFVGVGECLFPLFNQTLCSAHSVSYSPQCS